MLDCKSKRIEYIDIAKGISIALVALFHSELAHFMPNIIEPMSLFRVPLFFFLSGIFFSYSLTLKAFLIKKADALLKPYFFVLICVYCLSFIYKEGYRFDELIGIFYANGSTLRWTPLWFLSHLFVVYSVAFLLFKKTGFSVLPLSIKIVLITASLVAGTLVLHFFYAIRFDFISLTVTGLPYSIDLLLITLTYFILGYLLRDYLLRFEVTYVFFFFCLTIFILISYFFSVKIDLNMRFLSLPLLSFIGSVCGIYLVLSLSYWLKQLDCIKKAFLLIGRASLFILIFHHWFGSKIYGVAISLFGEGDNVIYLALLAFLGSVVIPVILQFFVKSIPQLRMCFFPFQDNRQQSG